MAVRVHVIGKGNIEAVFQCHQRGHGVGAGAIHAYLAVVVQGHKGKGRVHVGVDDIHAQPVNLVDFLVNSDAGATQGVNTDLQPGGPDCLHVDDSCQCLHVGRHIVEVANKLALQRRLVVQFDHIAQSVSQNVVGALLDTRGYIHIRRSAVGRVVLEAAVLGRIVRGADYDAVRLLAVLPVVGQHREGDQWRGCEAVICCDQGRYAVTGQHLDGIFLGGGGQGMGVLANENRAVDARFPPVFTYRLGDGQDVMPVEAPGEGAAAVAGGAKADALCADLRVRGKFMIGLYQGGNVRQPLSGNQLSCQ